MLAIERDRKNSFAGLSYSTHFKSRIRRWVRPVAKGCNIEKVEPLKHADSG
jgi:hypothetical protein